MCLQIRSQSLMWFLAALVMTQTKYLMIVLIGCPRETRSQLAAAFFSQKPALEPLNGSTLVNTYNCTDDWSGFCLL